MQTYGTIRMLIGTFCMVILALALSACVQTPAPNTGDEAFEISQDRFSETYLLILDGFDADERESMEAMLEDMPRFLELRYKDGDDNGARYQEYWYRTELEKPRMKKNLKKALDYMSVNGVVESRGQKIKVTKLSRHRKDREEGGREWDR